MQKTRNPRVSAMDLSIQFVGSYKYITWHIIAHL